MVWIKILQWAVFLILLVFTFTAFPSYKAFYQSQFLPTVYETKPVDTNPDSLYLKIKHYADEHNVQPIDAKIDKVWKAIPGYNGLTINVKASYEKQKKAKAFRPDRLIYEEVSPSIHLSDLQPAPIFRGNPKKPMVALAFDVADGEEDIPKILNILSQANVSATFYLDGDWVKKHAELALMISDEGHEIGNYSLTQEDLSTQSKEEMVTKINKTNDIIEATLDVTPKWFTPPMGKYNQQMLNVAYSLNLMTTLWTIDAGDGNSGQPTSMVRRVANEVESGSIIRFSPTESTVKALEMIIGSIKKKGFQLGTLSELTNENRIDN